MSGIYEFLEPFDILDAAIDACLSQTVDGWVEFQRQERTPASVVYQLSTEGLDLGTVTLRKIGPQSTVLEIGGPPILIGRDPTPEELAEIRATADLEARREAYSTLGAKIRQETEDLYRQCKQHQLRVLQDLFRRLAEEPGAWCSAKLHPPGPERAYGATRAVQGDVEYRTMT